MYTHLYKSQKCLVLLRPFLELYIFLSSSEEPKVVFDDNSFARKLLLHVRKNIGKLHFLFHSHLTMIMSLYWFGIYWETVFKVTYQCRIIRHLSCINVNSWDAYSVISLYSSCTWNLKPVNGIDIYCEKALILLQHLPVKGMNSLINIYLDANWSTNACVVQNIQHSSLIKAEN